MNEIEVLKEKLEKKLEEEYKEFVDELKTKSPEIIIDRSYENTIKKEMIYKIMDRQYEIIELKVLLKRECLLDEFYEAWLKVDGDINEVFEFTIDNSVDKIMCEFDRRMKEKSNESR